MRCNLAMTSEDTSWSAFRQTNKRLKKNCVAAFGSFALTRKQRAVSTDSIHPLSQKEQELTNRSAGYLLATFLANALTCNSLGTGFRARLWREFVQSAIVSHLATQHILLCFKNSLTYHHLRHAEKRNQA